ncbi:MAG: (Fe-S)-binding protein [Promethearchaeati archaeon]
MNEDKILDQIESCIDCMSCLEVCDTYLATDNDLQSPNGRLKIAEKVFTNQKISEEERFGIYTCTLCSLCDTVCTQEISISEIIHATKIKLSKTEMGPYEIHNKISKGIIEKDNSVNGKPEERLDWLPEKYKDLENFDNRKSDTLLFLGCMSSFKVKESASASYQILKKADYEFKILKNEPCCGEYLYSAGKLEEAKKYFKKTYEILKQNGIKNIIVTCAGCLYAFNNVYPQYIEGYDIEVRHVVQVIYDLVKEGKIKLKKLDGKEITYHDACRMGRKIKGMDIYDEPRELLNQIGINIQELPKNRVESPCCGAGSGIRGVAKDLCIDIGTSVLNNLDNGEIVSSCPLCIFNYRYVNYKNQLDKSIKYITEYILDAME